MADRNQSILLTGATGYVGGRLLPMLEAAGYQVRCMTRRPEALTSKVGEKTVVVKADVLDMNSLAAAMLGVDTAFYFVHSMGSKSDFETEDRQTAIFDPVGLFGLAYWYSLYPLHQLVFAGMLRNVVKAGEQNAARYLDAASEQHAASEHDDDDADSESELPYTEPPGEA